jgi:hypothetical protein
MQDPKNSGKLAKTESPKAFALAAYGDFARHNSLSQVRSMALTLPNVEERKKIADSLQMFQTRHSAADPFVLIGLPNRAKRAMALQQLLQTPLTWPERYDIANSHMLPLLDDPDERNREFAENALQQLTFELFRSPVLRPISAQSDEERRALSAKWEGFWSQMNDVSQLRDRGQLIAGDLSFERQLMHAYAHFPDTNDISPVIELANSELTPADKVRLVKSLFAFQSQYGVTRECQDTLIMVCCELARFPKRQQLKWANAVSLRECKDCLEKTLRKRNFNAWKMHQTILKATGDTARRAKIMQLLLEQYPETKYAQMLKQDDVP